MPRLQLERWTLRVHRWSGLLGALVFVVVGLSGAVLVFHEELDAALFPELFDAPGTTPSYQRAFELTQEAFPGAWVRGMRVSKDPGRSVIVQAIPPGGGPALIAIVDPHRGELRGTRKQGYGHTRLRDDPVSWLYEFHYQLTLGKKGQGVVVFASLLLLLSSLTGAVVYRRHLLAALTFRRGLQRRNPRTLASSAHRLIGTWALALNLLLGASGLWMLRGTLTADFWRRPEGRAAPAAIPPASRHGFDAALSRAREAVPGFLPSWMELSAAGAAAGPDLGSREAASRFYLLGKRPDEAAVYGPYATTVIVRADSLTVESVSHARGAAVGAQIDRLAFPLHQGHWGGLPVKLLYVLAGLGLPLLSLTGAFMWFARTRRRGGAVVASPRPVAPLGTARDQAL